MQTLRDSLLAMQSSILWQEGAADSIVADDVFESSERLQFYRNNVVIGLTDALAAVFPVVKKLVGEDFFRVACREYIPLHPPRHAQIQAYGDKFDEFLREFPAADSLPYLADVAALEWARHLAYSAADTDRLTPEALAEIPVLQQENLCFRFSPATRLVKSEYPVHQIWSANQASYAGEVTVNLDDGGEFVIVSRPGNEVLVESIAASEWAFLAALQGGETIDLALKAAQLVDPGFDIAAVLAARVGDGVIKEFYI